MIFEKEGFFMLKNSTLKICRTAIIAGLYIVLSLLVFPIASGAIQFRVSEGLTMLALVFPESIVGLFIGCLLSNLITGCVVFDVIFGSLITLVAGILTHLCGRFIKNTFAKVFAGGLFPVLLNAFLLPLVWLLCGIQEQAYLIQACLIMVGQALAVYGVGTPLYLSIKKLRNKGVSVFM